MAAADQDADQERAGWADLPPAFLCHILARIPYKRADVRAVCSAWRGAVNAGVDAARLPCDDWELALAQLVNVRHLAVLGRHAGDSYTKQAHGHGHGSQQAAAWPPSSSGERSQRGRAAAAAGGRSAEPGVATVWQGAREALLRRLLSLRLADCAGLARQLAQHCAGAAPGGLDQLRRLELAGAGDVGASLPALLGLLPGWRGAPLQHLSELQLSHCRLPAQRGQLAGLQLLPALRALGLASCGLQELPDALCACSRLTRLSLGHNALGMLPEALGNLQALEVLDLAGNECLRCASPLSRLTALRELSLAGRCGLWLDWSGAYSAAGCAATAADAAAVPADAGGAPAAGSAAAARAALPALLPALPHQHQLALLPQLAALTGLTRLDVSGNRSLRVLPACLSRLAQLAELDARGCGLRWLGDEVLECSGLQRLLLADNVLAEVPPDLHRLSALSELNLGCCSSLWRLPPALLALPRLARLVLPSRAAGQGVVERLELRQQPVDIVMDPAEGLSEAEPDDQEPPASSDESSDSGCG